MVGWGLPLRPVSHDRGCQGLADLFVEHAFRPHGFPNSVVSDRGPQIAAAFWQRLCNIGWASAATSALPSTRSLMAGMSVRTPSWNNNFAPI